MTNSIAKVAGSDIFHIHSNYLQYKQINLILFISIGYLYISLQVKIKYIVSYQFWMNLNLLYLSILFFECLILGMLYVLLHTFKVYMEDNEY